MNVSGSSRTFSTKLSWGNTSIDVSAIGMYPVSQASMTETCRRCPHADREVPIHFSTSFFSFALLHDRPHFVPSRTKYYCIHTKYLLVSVMVDISIATYYVPGRQVHMYSYRFGSSRYRRTRRKTNPSSTSPHCVPFTLTHDSKSP